MTTSDVWTLRFPGVQALYRGTAHGGDPLVVVAGGRQPSLRWMASFFPKKELWCADSGLVSCLKSGFEPQRLIGDGDSAPAAAWDRTVRRGVAVERFPADKDWTDLQLTLFAAGRDRPRQPIVVTGCWGGRFDHLFSLIFSARWASEWRATVRAFADHREILLLLRGGERMDLRLGRRKGALLSLLPLSEVCSDIRLSGTFWDLMGTDLFQGRPYAISNRPGDKGTPSVALGDGLLGVYLTWQ